MHMTSPLFLILTAIGAAIITGCVYEVSGCNDIICFSASDNTCTGVHCDERLACEDAAHIQQRMANIVSQARSHSRQCGATKYSVANTVFWNSKLASAAEAHSKDMAQHNFLSHFGSDGSSAEDRVLITNYAYEKLAENIAGGHETSTSVINAWLNSSEHCANLMNPSMREIGAYCSKNHHSDHKTYWTLVMGAPFINNPSP